MATQCQNAPLRRRLILRRISTRNALLTARSRLSLAASGKRHKEQITVAAKSVPGAESVRKVAPEAGMPAVERFRNYRWQTTKPPIGSVTKEEMEERLSNNVIRTRVYPGDKTSQTILDIVNSVSSIERWMWVNRGETRFVETIPPEELDAMLVDYFMTLRKSTGEDYKVDSFGKMRSCLERFLRDCRYPVSLRKSAVFGRSQNAYDMRRKAIMLQCFEKTGQDGPGFYGM